MGEGEMVIKHFEELITTETTEYSVNQAAIQQAVADAVAEFLG